MGQDTTTLCLNGWIKFGVTRYRDELSTYSITEVEARGRCKCKRVHLTVDMQGGGVGGRGGGVVGVTGVVAVVLGAGISDRQHAGIGPQFLPGGNQNKRVN